MADLNHLRECKHHTMRVRGQPCPHGDCVIRNQAADEIERLREALKDEYMLGYKTGLDDGFNQ